MKSFNELFNVEVVKKLAKSNINSIDVFFDDDGNMHTYLTDIVSGSLGIYQLKAMADLIGLELSLDDGESLEDYITIIEDSYSVIADNFNFNNKDVNGYFYFDYLECDNSFGLFYACDANMRIYPINQVYVFTINNNIVFSGTFRSCIEYVKNLK